MFQERNWNHLTCTNILRISYEVSKTKIHKYSSRSGCFINVLIVDIFINIILKEKCYLKFIFVLCAKHLNWDTCLLLIVWVVKTRCFAKARSSYAKRETESLVKLVTWLPTTCMTSGSGILIFWGICLIFWKIRRLSENDLEFIQLLKKKSGNTIAIDLERLSPEATVFVSLFIISFLKMRWLIHEGHIINH